MQLDWMAEVICHPHSTIKFAVSYDRLVSAQQPEVECLCQNLNLAFSPAMMRAIEKQHVPGAKKTPGEMWNLRQKVKQLALEQGCLKSVATMWRRFGEEPNWENLV
jgi:hypothetical protein